MKPKNKNKFIRLIIILNIIVTVFICIFAYIYIKNQEQGEIVKEITEAHIQRQELDSDFVDIRDFIPEISIDLQYATPANVTEKRLYSYEYPFLRRGTAIKLKRANEEFMKMGYTIKVWDSYRPVNVQYKLWDKVPDRRYIADPVSGSKHNRGAAVDITLVDSNGNELDMPTGFDGFSQKADKNYSDVSKKQADNAKLLEDVMVRNGFTSIYTEWWHFDDSDYKKYDIVQEVIRLMAVKPLVLLEEDNDRFEIDVVDSSIDIIVNIFDKISITKIKNGLNSLIDKLLLY